MLNTTVSKLSCPKRSSAKARMSQGRGRKCGGSLQLFDFKGSTGYKVSKPSQKSSKDRVTPVVSAVLAQSVFEVRTGELKCTQCGARFPILGGVAVVVADVRDYVLSHVKGIAQIVSDDEIPKEYRREFLEAKAEIQFEHIEEDLEAQRVNALYLMNHYLRVSDLQPSSGKPWWKSEVDPMGAPSLTGDPGSHSAGERRDKLQEIPSKSLSKTPSKIPLKTTQDTLIDKLVREYWDHGPFAQIGKWLSERKLKSPGSESQRDVLELGCGVGGLCLVLKPYARSYLGVDSSFASISLARHLILGVPGPKGAILIPEDLLAGSVSRPVRLQVHKYTDQDADFIVGDLSNLPLYDAGYDLVLALNAIDMLDEPSQLPEVKFQLLKKSGITIQSSPYIWHEAVAAKLRRQIPKKMKDSSRAVEWLYERAGFKIEEMCENLPWLFFKNVRQLEVYSVHLFLARK